MMFTSKNRWYTTAVILFIVTLLVSALSALGLGFPHSQAEILNAYGNLFVPVDFTFAIWVVIAIAMAFTLALPWLKAGSQAFQAFYHERVMPYYVVWLLASLLWLVFWSFDLVFLAFLAVLVYAGALLGLVRLIQQRADLNDRTPWLLKIPVGFHAGWVVFLAFVNFMTLMVKWGLNSFSYFDMVLTVILLVVACAAIFWLYDRYDNFALTVPTFWMLFGVMVKQRPDSAFAHPNAYVMGLAYVLMIGALALHIKILKEHQFSREAKV